MKTTIYTLLAIIICAVGIKAQRDEIKVPPEVQPFVEKGAKVLSLESADLNGDNLKDYVLVFERQNVTEKDEFDYPKNQRPLLILTRGADKKLTEANRNEQIIMCSECGGVMGDPFMAVYVGKNTFTVNHYGGSAWRWDISYKFNYSRIDKTWQLVQFKCEDFHAADQTKTMKREIKLPKDFGKIDIVDFNPSIFDDKVAEQNSLSDEEIGDLLPEGYRTIHQVVSGDFGGWNSGGQNKPEADSKTKFVMPISNQTPADKYISEVIIPSGFEAFEKIELPEPQNTWGIMEPLAVFFDNVDKDSEKELLVLERCMTGVGARGNEYFFRTRVYDWNGKSFVHLDRLSEKIGNLDTAAKVQKMLAGMKK